MMRTNGRGAVRGTTAVLPNFVIKRDGREAAFDPARIDSALERCFAGIKRTPSASVSDLVSRVINLTMARTGGKTPGVEDIQDIVEMVLQAAGEFEAAKHYILYRAEHAKQRQERPIPPEVMLAFSKAETYFPTEVQKFQFYDKYSRFDYALGRRETWIETVNRAVDYLHELAGSRLPPVTYERIRRAILEMRAMPSMRLLAMAGEPARQQGLSIFNCFAGDTEIVTSAGVRKLRELAGESAAVMTLDGQWRPAQILSFGRQPLQSITMQHWNGGKHGDTLHLVQATPEHRWILSDGSVTTSLKVGDKLTSPNLVDPSTMDPDGIRHGIVYGDGTLVHTNGVAYAQVRLCGDKKALAEQYFSGFKKSFPPSFKPGEPMVYCGRERSHWKDLPERTDPAYVAGFIHGLGLTDGSPTDGGNLRIGTQRQDLVDWLYYYAGSAGYKVLSHRVYDEPTNYGPRKSPLHAIMIGSGRSATMQVVKIESGYEAEVFCATEPVTQSFLLANGQITGNCAYRPVDSIDAYPEALIISMSGCGLGFSVERDYVEQIPRIARQRGGPVKTWVIEDSTMGWATAVRLGMEHWFSGDDIRFDCSEIRPAGAPLRTKGGRASGPLPLQQLLEFARQRILARQGGFLRPIDAHDIMCSVGSAAVAGGSRRTAMLSLFDVDDLEMRNCKNGDFERDNSQRWNANNSAVWPEDGIDQVTFMRQFIDMLAGERGEPGFFSREAMKRTIPVGRRDGTRYGTNPCAEIILRPCELCNLSIAVARADDTIMSLTDKVEIATIIGTIQSLVTNYPGLGDQWRKNAEEERLLGVDITGQLDSPIAQDPAVMRHLQKTVWDTNAMTADLLGINHSTSVTCVKPSGNSSVLLNASSGLHARWAPYYVRNARVSAHSPVFKVLRDAGAPMDPENGQTPEDANTWVVHFPVKSPDGAVTRNDRSALEQCEYWLRNKVNWTSHNPSVTILYRPDEAMDVQKWIWENRQLIGGMAFLPTFDAKYAQLPYIEITEDEYERLAADFPVVDWSRIYRYEDTDLTTAASEVACSAGSECMLE